METKINNNYVVQIFAANVFICVVFCIILGASMYPSYLEIQDEKSQLSQQYTIYREISEKGISLNEFTSKVNQDKAATDYLKDIIKIIPESFYDKNIKNTSWGTFLSFIQNKIAKIESSKKDKLLEQRDQKLQAILPSYTDNGASIDNQNNITEFKFVNYVESLLYAFDLSSSSTIGISDLVPVKQFTESLTKQDSSIDTNIYYIPLKLEVTGKKTDIIDFLHFVENVGSISIWKDQDIQVFEDQELKNILPEGDGKNIYQNQVFDVEVMKMTSYLDSSLSPSDLPLVDLVKKDQANESIDLELQLRFYVKGLPNYLVKKYVKDTADKYDGLVKRVDKKMKDVSMIQFETSDQIIMANSVKTLSYDLQTISDDIKKLKMGLAKNEDIAALYRKSTSYMSKFTSIENTLDKIDKKLQLSK